jgi:hypothetical protein
MSCCAARVARFQHLARLLAGSSATLVWAIADLLPGGRQSKDYGFIVLPQHNLAPEHISQRPATVTIAQLQSDDLVGRLIEEDAERLAFARNRSHQ